MCRNILYINFVLINFVDEFNYKIYSVYIFTCIYLFFSSDVFFFHFLPFSSSSVSLMVLLTKGESLLLGNTELTPVIYVNAISLPFPLL